MNTTDIKRRAGIVENEAMNAHTVRVRARGAQREIEKVMKALRYDQNTMRNQHMLMNLQSAMDKLNDLVG